jgi:hypothetical protein
MTSNDKENRFNSMTLMSEEIGFKNDEMNACPACGRLNPPNRLNCLYCAAQFEIGTIDLSRVKLTSRRLESWEKGYNVVAVNFPATVDEVRLEEVARNTGVEISVLRETAGRTTPLPLVRVGKHDEAEIVAANLSRIGLAVVIVADAELVADKPPARCRLLTFGENSITFVPLNSGADVELNHSVIELIVSGSIYESKVESVKQRKIRNSTTRIDSEVSSDMPLIDVYSRSHPLGFRIPANGFDFSCLGPEKVYIASQNLKALLRKLTELAPDAKLVSDYENDRRLLDHVWDVDERTESLGIKRSGFAKKDLASVTTRSNLLQFTKYSRLQRHLL